MDTGANEEGQGMTTDCETPEYRAWAASRAEKLQRTGSAWGWPSATLWRHLTGRAGELADFDREHEEGGSSDGV